MDVQYQNFIWDDKKAQMNLRKHGISFMDAIYVFYDPALLEIYDTEKSTPEEDRYKVSVL